MTLSYGLIIHIREAMIESFEFSSHCAENKQMGYNFSGAQLRVRPWCTVHWSIVRARVASSTEGRWVIRCMHANVTYRQAEPLGDVGSPELV